MVHPLQKPTPQMIHILDLEKKIDFPIQFSAILALNFPFLKEEQIQL